MDGALLEYIDRERHACIIRCLIMGLIHKNGKHSAGWEVGGDTSSHVYCNRAQAWGKPGATGGGLNSKGGSSVAVEQGRLYNYIRRSFYYERIVLHIDKTIFE